MFETIELQQVALPGILVGFWGWRKWRKQMTQRKIPELLKAGATIVDVRSPAEFAAGANPKSVNIPLGDLEGATGRLDREKPVVVCCASGGRSAMAAAILKARGFGEVLNAGPWQNTLV